MGSDWRCHVVLFLIALFSVSIVQSLRTAWRVRRTLREQINGPRPTWAALHALTRTLDRPLPYILILVPARDESAVIHNTLGRLAELDYPPDRYAVVVIADARERQGRTGPTTYDVANQVAQSWCHDREKSPVHVIEVPESYGGRFADPTPTFARSTKGRALNYALEHVRQHPQLSQADMLGVLDADGRLHVEVLREVAYLALARGERLMQGPVFQISNLSQVGLAGKAAGIELSVYHLSTLSRQLLSGRDTARFLAGTNYFVDPRLMIEVGAWNDTALVEDAELGLRLYLQKRVKPAWLSCHEVEQTPPDVSSYLRQRRRWALGHFQLLPIVRNSGLPWYLKAELYGKLLHSIFTCPLDVGLPVLGWTAFALQLGRRPPGTFPLGDARFADGLAVRLGLFWAGPPHAQPLRSLAHPLAQAMADFPAVRRGDALAHGLAGRAAFCRLVSVPLRAIQRRLAEDSAHGGNPCSLAGDAGRCRRRRCPPHPQKLPRRPRIPGSRRMRRSRIFLAALCLLSATVARARTLARARRNRRLPFSPLERSC